MTGSAGVQSDGVKDLGGVRYRFDKARGCMVKVWKIKAVEFTPGTRARDGKPYICVDWREAQADGPWSDALFRARDLIWAELTRRRKTLAVNVDDCGCVTTNRRWE